MNFSSQFLVILVAVFVLFLLQQSFLGPFSYVGSLVNFIFIFVLFGNIFLAKKVGLAIGFFSGLFLDIFASSSFGVLTITFLGLAFLVQSSKALFFEHSLVSMVAIFILSFLFFQFAPLALGCLSSFLSGHSPDFSLWPGWFSLVLSFLSNFVICLLLFFIFGFKKRYRFGYGEKIY